MCFFPFPRSTRLASNLLHRPQGTTNPFVSSVLSANSFEQSVPLSLRAMFDQYFQLGQRIRKHYLSPSVILCLATGQFVPPIHRKNLYSLQYSMLPARRAGILEVWTRLTEKPAKTTNGAVKIPNGIHARRAYRT